MEYVTISYDLGDDTAVITLDRPDSRNAMNTQMRAELLHAVRRAGREARVIVLTGAGKAFCSGQDLGEGKRAGSLDLEHMLRDEYAPLVHAIADSPVPVLAAVNGAAAGAGASLALAADVVVAAQSAYFMQAFSQVGLIPDAGATFALPRAVGMARATGAALFADKVPADKAAEWGMIYEAVPDDAFDAHWRARAAHLAKGPTRAYAMIRQAMHASTEHTLDEQLALEAKLQGQAGRTRDFKEGVLAFLDKREAKFEGR